MDGHLRASENLHPARDTKTRNKMAPLDVRIRPRGFPAMPDPIPASKDNSDNHNVQFLMILV